MKKRICTIILCYLVFSLIFPLHILAAPIGYFAMIKGDVKVKRADQTLMPTVKAPIEPKDLVITGGDGKAKLIFNDDSSMFLSPNTRLEVQDFVIKEGKRNGSFFIHVGKIIAEVTKFIGGDSSFTVNSPTATVGVRGTGFEVVVAEVAGKMTTTVACTAGFALRFGTFGDGGGGLFRRPNGRSDRHYHLDGDHNGLSRCRRSRWLLN